MRHKRTGFSASCAQGRCPGSSTIVQDVQGDSTALDTDCLQLQIPAYRERPWTSWTTLDRAMNTSSSGQDTVDTTPDGPRTDPGHGNRKAAIANSARAEPEVIAHKAKHPHAPMVVWGGEVWVWTGTRYRVAMVAEREHAHELAGYLGRKLSGTS